MNVVLFRLPNKAATYIYLINNTSTKSLPLPMPVKQCVELCETIS